MTWEELTADRTPAERAIVRHVRNLISACQVPEDADDVSRFLALLADKAGDAAEGMRLARLQDDEGTQADITALFGGPHDNANDARHYRRLTGMRR